MKDGRTRKVAQTGKALDFAAYRTHYDAALIVVAGGAEGSEFGIDREHLTLGRGPGVDLAFADTAMSRQHAALEFSNEGFSIRDLGSTNGTRVNGSEIQGAELKHGDRIEIGDHAFQLVIEKRKQGPKTYVIEGA